MLLLSITSFAISKLSKKMPEIEAKIAEMNAKKESGEEITEQGYKVVHK